MARILDCMPFSDDPGEIVVRGKRIRVRANQIILWASLTLSRVDVPNPRAVPFPVIVDTGYTHSFSIQARHQIEWAGIRPETLASRGTIRDRTQTIPLREINLWGHPDVRRQREELADRPSHLIRSDKGIAVYPTGDFPRLPILGLKAIAENNLILKVDGQKREATLRTPIAWWPFW